MDDVRGNLDAQRLERLLAAGRAVVSELDLDAVLEQVLATARELTGARYAALGVMNDERTALRDFVTSGIDRETHRAIGDLPHGRGVLGLLITDPQPLRLADVTEHPQSYGFPPAHPAMSTFLGVPVIIRGEAWGNLYLTEKEGGEEFDDADEESAVTLAGWAAIAIDNARLYEGADRRRAELERAVRGLEATTAIARAIGGETRLERVLELIVKRGRALVSARGVLIALLDGEDLVVAATAGEMPAGLKGRRLPVAESELGDVLRSRRPERVADVAARLRGSGRQLGLSDARSALLVPLDFRGRAVGVLAAFDRIDDVEGFEADDERLMLGFAASAATAVATAQTVERDRLRHALRAAEEERGRWARELHDETLQGLAALRVGLSAAAREPDAEALRAHVSAAVDQIAHEIENLRGIITDLRPAALDQLGLGAALETLADRLAATEGLDVQLAVELDRLEPEVETTVYRLVQEALTNVKKHARATTVRVDVRTADGRVELSVADDGAGFDPAAATAGFGVAGMRERAALLGGTLDVVSGDDGTTVRASLPARRDAPPLPVSA
ncbi:MAG TPA: GAF domain-containing sensor histidine kinase [Solirubrobacteraceae bacterium]|jgi:signal transduction histidine kinase